MTTKHKNYKRKRAFFLISLVLLILIVLIGYFRSNEKEEVSTETTYRPLERSKDPLPPKVISTCQINHTKKHRLSRELITKDTVWVRIEPLIDISQQLSDYYPDWQQKCEILARQKVHALLGYRKRMVRTNIQVYSIADYQDDFPEPDMTLELYLMDFSMTRGRKERFKKSYCATLEGEEYVTTDITHTSKYKKINMTGLTRLLDNECRLINMREDKIEAVESENWTYYEGPKHILPKAETLLYNRLPYQLVKLKDDKYITHQALDKLYTRMLGKFSSVINPLTTKRDGLKLHNNTRLFEQP